MQRSALDLINARYSCRLYRDQPIEADARCELEEHLAAHTVGPFGAQARFAVVAAAPGDDTALRRLGTYGFIKGATGFLVGAVRRAPRDLEDYGYLVEQAILHATGLGIGTCWLGGTFTRSTFTRRLGRLEKDETMPAVAALGYPGDDGGVARIHEREAGRRKLPASSLFFGERFGQPLAPPAGDPYTTVLEAVRMAPSATNKQPWRIVRRSGDWHFYLQRSKAYGKGSLRASFAFGLLRIADLQRVDLGIAMCHFDLVARELGLHGALVLDEPADSGPLPSGAEYSATWRSAGI